MSIIVKKNDDVDIPEGAVKLSREEALELQWKIISDWTPKSETWSFRYGPGVLAGSSILSSLSLMSHYRRRFKLFKYGKLYMFFPGVVVPSLILPMIYSRIVTEPILLQNECPVCIQVRSMCLQATAGVGYPLIVHSSLAMVLAYCYSTMRLPTKPRAFGELFLKTTRPLQTRLSWLCLCQAALGAFVSHRQAKTVHHIQNKDMQPHQQ